MAPQEENFAPFYRRKRGGSFPSRYAIGIRLAVSVTICTEYALKTLGKEDTEPSHYRHITVTSPLQHHISPVF